MAEAKKYEPGSMFKSTRFDDEVFVITDVIKITKETKAGKVTVSGSSYEMSYIPEITERLLPNGNTWVHNRLPFITHDELIDREISLGNWSKM